MSRPPRGPVAVTAAGLLVATMLTGCRAGADPARDPAGSPSGADTGTAAAERVERALRSAEEVLAEVERAVAEDS